MKNYRSWIPWLIVGLLAGNLLPAQDNKAPSQPAPPPQTVELPVLFTQDVSAGKTAVGSKVEARLIVSTLLAGKVIPRNAVVSGQVTESVAKTKTDPSRLSVRVDSIKWKDGSLPVAIYLTSWFYPTLQQTGPDLQYGPTLPATRTWNETGGYPSQDCKVCNPLPNGDSNDHSSSPGAPNQVASTHPSRMKDVQTERTSDGGLQLASHRSNLKLDRLTVYLLASPDDPINSK